MVKLTWLKELFSECPEDALLEETECWCLPSIPSRQYNIFYNNREQSPFMYLSLFEDFDKAGKFAWGAGALAFLYRALGNASLKSQSTISGCLTLLQCWSYSRLNVGQPKFNQEPDNNCFPFVLKWKGKSGSRTKCNVESHRKALDSLNPCDVQWLPYKDMACTAIPEDIKASLVLWASRTMLLCFDKAERHLPDRCLRQFGMHQTIPTEVEQWERKQDHGLDLMGKMELALKEWSERWVHIVEGSDIADEVEYMQWYQKITWKYIGESHIIPGIKVSSYCYERNCKYYRYSLCRRVGSL